MHKITLPRSLFFRISAYILFFILVGAAIRYKGLVSVIQSDLTRVVSIQLEALSRDMANTVDYKINERQKMLLQLAQTLPKALVNNPQAMRRWLAEHFEMHPVFRHGLYLILPNGRSPTDYPEQVVRRDISYADRDYFQGALSGHFTIGRPIIDRVLNEPMLPMGPPSGTRQGK